MRQGRHPLSHAFIGEPIQVLRIVDEPGPGGLGRDVGEPQRQKRRRQRPGCCRLRGSLDWSLGKHLGAGPRLGAPTPLGTRLGHPCPSVEPRAVHGGGRAANPAWTIATGPATA